MAHAKHARQLTMKTQIIIPMSGFGERFRSAGYLVPKALIKIDGKPMIGHVLDLFPGEKDVVFVCNSDHLKNPRFRMEETIHCLCPTGRVVGIAPHKLGPVHAVLQVADLLDMEMPTVVNYCDFSCYWSWTNFQAFVSKVSCAGAIPAYRGFHPHSLGTTNYAYIREKNGRVLDIQEKRPFTDHRMDEYASSGTYFFSSARIMLDALRSMVSQNLNVGGEYYVSLAYKSLLAKGLPVSVYELQHFMQWGTPDDLTEYQRWSNTFRCLANTSHVRRARIGGAVVIPMAGLGQRFLHEGYQISKPLIHVSGRPMVIQAVTHLPQADHYAFVLRRDMPGADSISEALRRQLPDAHIETVAGLTDGQACTAEIGLRALGRHNGNKGPEPVTFGACDFGALYDDQKLQSLMNSTDCDVIVWSVRGHTNAVRHPEMYGWIDCDGDHIRRISVKTPLATPAIDPIVLGTFTFKRSGDFHRCIQRMIDRKAKVNGEYYLDTCINDALDLGLRCRLFEVHSYISWGTPNDLRTFEYWQSCFHKWPSHPYRLELDGFVPECERPTLESRYQAVAPSSAAQDR